MISNKMHVVIIESDGGFDCFGNAKGEPIIMETLVAKSSKHDAIDAAARFSSGNRHGRVLIAEVNVIGEVIDGNLHTGEVK